MSRWTNIERRSKAISTFIFFLKSVDIEVGAAADMKHGYGSLAFERDRDRER